MFIEFNKDTELEVVDRFNAETDNIDESHNEVFKNGTWYDVDIISVGDNPDYVDLQLGWSGGLILSVLRSCFTVREEDKG